MPEAVLAALCQFELLEGAVAAVVTALQANHKLARIELLDEVQMRAAINYSNSTMQRRRRSSSNSRAPRMGYARTSR